MVTKQNTEESRIADLIEQILSGARLFLSGGQEQTFVGLKAGIEEAAKQVLNRLYPKFNDGDSANWPQVLRKAKEGSPSALQSIGFAGDPPTHPVASAIITFVGAGRTGLDVRKKFNGPPYGWPQDAIDAVLTTLLASSHLSARLNSLPLTFGDVDQKKLGQAVFRIESPVLSATQKLAIRKLFQEVGLPNFKPGNESADAIRFVDFAKAAAAAAGGDPPAPVAPAAPEVTALESLSGNDLLMALYERRDPLQAQVQVWQATGKEVARRLPAFRLTEKLVAQAIGITDQSEWSANLSSIRANRTLLDNPDPVSPVLKAAANTLRASLAEVQKSRAAMFAAQLARIGDNTAWLKLSAEKRELLLANAGASRKAAPVVDSDDQLLTALESCSLSNWQSETDALSAQFDRALATAIIETEPKAQRVKLPTETIHNDIELAAWVARSTATITAALKHGPVIL